MQIPLLPASLRPPITSRPVGTPFLGREKGRTVNRAGPGRDDWEGAGGSVGQDPGRVLLRFSHGDANVCDAQQGKVGSSGGPTESKSGSEGS